MNIKFLVPSVLALSVLAVPAFAQDYRQPITGSQMTDRPSQRSNVTRTGSLVRPKTDLYVRDNGYGAAARAYEQGYRQGYADRGYDDR